MGSRADVRMLKAGIVFCSLVLLLIQPVRCAEVDPETAAPTNESIGLGATNQSGSPVNPDVIQKAIEQLRQEAEPAAKQQIESPPATNTIPNTVAAPDKTDILEDRLNLVERTLRLQHETELEAVHSSNRTVVVVAGILGGCVLAGMLGAVLMLTRTMNRFAEVTMSLPVAGGWRSGGAAPMLGAGGLGDTERINAKFVGTVERLEKRILELEQAASPRSDAVLEAPRPIEEPKAVGPKSSVEGAVLEADAIALKQAPPEAAPFATPIPVAERESQVSILIGKGQALLNLGRAEEALRSFERAITLDERNPEAHIRRGVALEKLHKMEQALESYDRAIAADSSMTLAYLHKGAVCNRLQRFNDALACYERALRSERKPVIS